MSAPNVGVTAFFADLLCFLSARDDLAGFEVEQTEEARVAVDELIATQRETLRMLEAAYRQLGMWTDDNKRIQRAKAALANMGTQS